MRHKGLSRGLEQGAIQAGGRALFPRRDESLTRSNAYMLVHFEDHPMKVNWGQWGYAKGTKLTYLTDSFQ